MAKIVFGDAPARPATTSVTPGSVVAIVVNYRTARLAIRAVESILASTGLNAPPQVIVIDNASGDDSVTQLRERFDDDATVTVFARRSNDGYTGGNNAGVALARQWGAEFAFILNPDAEVDPECLRLLLAELANEPAAALVVPRIFLGENDRILWFAGGRFSLFTGRPRQHAFPTSRSTLPTAFATGCALAVRLAALPDPLFDTSLFMYAEDLELCLRAREAGYAIHYVPDAVARHHAAAAAGPQAMRFYMNTRNLLRVTSRYARWYHWPALAPMLAVDVVGRFCAVAARDRDPAAFAAVLRGAWHAFSHGTHPVERRPRTPERRPRR